MTDKRALKFFVVHGVLDIEHSGAERKMLGVLTEDADPAPIEQATRSALEAWWNFLSAVDQPATAAVCVSAATKKGPERLTLGEGGRRADGSSGVVTDSGWGAAKSRRPLRGMISHPSSP